MEVKRTRGRRIETGPITPGKETAMPNRPWSRIALLASGCVFALAACAAPPTEPEHASHHPGGAASGAPAGPALAPPESFEAQMHAMQDMHKRMLVAQTPAQRQALMAEHMKLMQSGMAMMSQMKPGGMGMAGGMGPPPGAAASGAAPNATASAGPGAMMGGMGMMGMHDAMERRMALMEQMMQMMVDREAAMPRR
jgi:hypothetical protein